jgi:hypothetical protein
MMVVVLHRESSNGVELWQIFKVIELLKHSCLCVHD